MGIRIENKFNRRFGGRIKVVYPDKPLSVSKFKLQKGELYAAFCLVLEGVLGRVTSPEELLGHKQFSDDISRKGLWAAGVPRTDKRRYQWKTKDEPAFSDTPQKKKSGGVS